jgi:hypothetical protein
MVKLPTAALLLLLTVCAAPAQSQEVKGETATPKDAPAADEEVRRAFLRRLKSIKLSVAGCGEHWDTYAELSKSYKAGDNICIRLVFTNTSDERVFYTLSDSLMRTRPQLYKEGNLVPYRRKVSEFIERGEKSYVSMRSIPVGLEPNEFKSVLLSLGDWYQPLPEGHYRLVIKRQFIAGGEWAEAPAVEFSVEPK